MEKKLAQVEKAHFVPSFCGKVKQDKVWKMFRTHMPYGCEYDEEKKQVAFFNCHMTYLGCDKKVNRISPFSSCKKWFFYNHGVTPLSSDKAFERYKALLYCFSDYVSVTSKDDPLKVTDLGSLLKQFGEKGKAIVEVERAVDVLGDIFCEDVAKYMMKFLEVEPHDYAPEGDPRRKNPLFRVCHCCDKIFHTFASESKTPRTRFHFEYAFLFLKRERLGLDWMKKMEKDDDKIDIVIEEHQIGPVCSRECRKRLEPLLADKYNRTGKMPDKTEFDDVSVFEPFVTKSGKCHMDYSRKARSQFTKNLDKYNHILVSDYHKGMERCKRKAITYTQRV